MRANRDGGPSTLSSENQIKSFLYDAWNSFGCVLEFSADDIFETEGDFSKAALTHQSVCRSAGHSARWLGLCILVMMQRNWIDKIDKDAVELERTGFVIVNQDPEWKD